MARIWTRRKDKTIYVATTALDDLLIAEALDNLRSSGALLPGYADVLDEIIERWKTGYDLQLAQLRALDELLQIHCFPKRPIGDRVDRSTKRNGDPINEMIEVFEHIGIEAGDKHTCRTPSAAEVARERREIMNGRNLKPKRLSKLSGSTSGAEEVFE